LDKCPGSLNTARYHFGGAGTQTAALAFGGNITATNSNRRMDRCRSSCNKNNYSKLTGGKYGTYKNIHSS
jgi:hypothetical protein